MTTKDLIDSITGYFETHRKALVTARDAIAKGNSSLAYDILKVTVQNIDIYMKKLEAIQA